MKDFWWVAAYKIEGLVSTRITSCYVQAVCEQHALNEAAKRLSSCVEDGCKLIAREVPNSEEAESPR
jgi:hypothetical protein